MRQYSAIFTSPVAAIGIIIHRESLVGMDFLYKNAVSKKPQDTLSREVTRQLQAYFSDSAFCFDLPLNPQGTVFQRTVWDALRKIKAGKTQSYGELADRLSTGARAIGNACRQNPIPVIIPCHRIVSASGIGGYSGQTEGEMLSRKRWLLAYENVHIS